MEQLHLISVYKNISVPSLLFDSTGTKKMAALASYIVEALEYGKILIIDELDNIAKKKNKYIVEVFNEILKSANFDVLK